MKTENAVKFTPGPVVRWQGFDADGYVVIESTHGKAATRSAAPDLLNMLQRMIDETTGGFTPCALTLEHARAAIQKARGE
jgi:hypothetical protein